MKAAKLPNEANKLTEDDYSDTNQYILLEPYENKKYSIRINKIDTGILIEANQIPNSNLFYKIELGLNDFYLLSKGFKMCDNLEDICDALQNIFLSKKVSIIKKDYSLLIIFTINLIGGKEQEVNIELNRNTINEENYDIKNKILKINELENEIKQMKNDKIALVTRINDLENLVKAQKDELEKLKSLVSEQNNIIEKLKNLENTVNEQKYKIVKINNLENDINEQKYKIGKIYSIEKTLTSQKNEIEKIKNWKNEYDSELQDMLITKINKMSLNKIDSKIINKKEELEFLENRLKNSEILKKKNITYKLLYRATKDGNNMQIFHNKCDNIMGTLTIIKTTKGMRFGGYTEQIWNDDNKKGVRRKDGKNVCFCFSLDLFKIYNFDYYNNKNDHSIHCNYNYGPYFCCTNEVFYIKNNNGFLCGCTGYTTGANSFGKFENDYEISGGQKDFSVIEMEVFQILFDN